MKKAALRVSESLELTLDYTTKTAGILAQRRKGKTYTASVIAEEMVAAGIPFVVLDPTGAWFGMRSAANGEDAGLPVVILGGQHGDVPLERTAGKLVADLVVDNPGHYILDLSAFEANAAEQQFATDFASRIYRRKIEPDKNFALHLFVDEADRFAPQRPMPGEQHMLGAFETIVRRGGSRGLGTTLITQRAAVLNKNLLEQVDMLILLRTVGPNDRAAVERYVKAHGSEEERRALMESLASLDLGEAWVWEPGADPALFQRLRVRERTTFNSSATPVAGQSRVEPRRLAKVDLAAIKEAMAATIETARNDDPKALRARIRELEAQQIAPPPPEVIVETVVERVEVPVFPDDLIGLLRVALESLTAVLAEFQDLAEIEDLAAAYQQARPASPDQPVQLPRAPAPTPTRPAAPTPPPPQPSTCTPPGKLGKAERAILVALAEKPMGRSKAQVAILAGYHPRSKSFLNALSALRTSGLIVGTGHLTITDPGLELVPGVLIPQDPLAFWIGKLGGLEGQILSYLVSAYPGVSTHDEVAAVCISSRGEPYHPRSKSFLNALSKLRGLGLVEGQRGQARASAELVEAR